MIEEFKRFGQDDIKTYLDEQKVENLAKAAAYADDHALAHNSTFNKSRSHGFTKKSYPKVGKKFENVAPVKSSDKGQTSNQTNPDSLPLYAIIVRNLGMLCLTVGS